MTFLDSWTIALYHLERNETGRLAVHSCIWKRLVGIDVDVMVDIRDTKHELVKQRIAVVM